MRVPTSCAWLQKPFLIEAGATPLSSDFSSLDRRGATRLVGAAGLHLSSGPRHRHCISPGSKVLHRLVQIRSRLSHEVFGTWLRAPRTRHRASRSRCPAAKYHRLRNLCQLDHSCVKNRQIDMVRPWPTDQGMSQLPRSLAIFLRSLNSGKHPLPVSKGLQACVRYQSLDGTVQDSGHLSYSGHGLAKKLSPISSRLSFASMLVVFEMTSVVTSSFSKSYISGTSTW